MKMKNIFLIIFFSVVMHISAENVVEADTTGSRLNKKPLDTIEITKVQTDSIDVFIDKDGDGIADNRNFMERKNKWRHSRNMSQKMFENKFGHTGLSGKSGKKAKQGNSGSGHEGGNGPGNGGGG